MKLEEDPISIVDVDNNNLLPLGFDLVVDVGFDLSFTIQRIGLSTVTKGRKKEIKTKRTMTEATKNYVEEYLPASIIEKLEAGAYQSLCNHLRERSDEVQNIDLMTISGFCRNCLAKVRKGNRNSFPLFFLELYFLVFEKENKADFCLIRLLPFFPPLVGLLVVARCGS